jgi:hypothetical protein
MSIRQFFMKPFFSRLLEALELLQFLSVFREKIVPLLPNLIPASDQSLKEDSSKLSIQKLRGSFLVIVGYLLSPLCWWNDLIINLPVACGFGYLCSLFSETFFMPGAIVGYWISNVAGVLLMQAGVMDMLQKQAEQRNLKKELMKGLLSSTAYTIVIVLLIHFKVLDGFDSSLLALIPQ